MKTFSSRVPWDPPKATAASLPMTWAATWVTASGMTGLTLPGMIDEPGWRSGMRISARPVRGPEPIQRRSLAIFTMATAMTRSSPEASTRPSRLAWAAKWSRASVMGSPVRAARAAMTAGAKAGGALMPVPTAVPPRGTSPTRPSTPSMRSAPWLIWAAKPPNS